MERVNAVELRELGGAGIDNAAFAAEEEPGEGEGEGARNVGSPRYEEGEREGEPPRGQPVDRGFACALALLVGGVLLVVVAYSVPREARADPERVSARQMERLEAYYARLGSRLDRCIIAGLGLLTLGGMLLSALLTASLCRGELRRRDAPRPIKSYGSVSMRMRQLAEGEEPAAHAQ